MLSESNLSTLVFKALKILTREGRLVFVEAFFQIVGQSAVHFYIKPLKQRHGFNALKCQLSYNVGEFFTRP